MSPRGGDDRVRTDGLLRARQALSHLSYTPMVALSQPCSFEDVLFHTPSKPYSASILSFSSILGFLFFRFHPRKEVIQPHLPIRLPCYDFTPVINPTFDCVLLAVRLQASGVTDSHGVTGGVYKARERIHRGMLIRDY